MRTSRLSTSGVRNELVSGLGLIAGLVCLFAPQARANEVMTDRCSQEVAFPEDYDAQPNTKGTIILKRGGKGMTPWSEPFKVHLGDDGHIRWWCHSTTGNWADLGTWELGFDPSGIGACITAVGATVVSEGAGAGSLATCAKVVKFGSSAWKGWTPERSRCGDHSTKVRARLGKDRLLQIECLGH